MTGAGRRRLRLAVLAGAGFFALVLAVRMSPDDPGRRSGPGQSALPGSDLREPAIVASLATWVPAPPRTAAGRVLAYLWASPVSVAGLMLAGLAGARPRAAGGVLVAAGAGGPVGGLLRARGFTATTLGHVVLTTATVPSAELLAHELVHVRQAERLGVLFGPVYVALLARYGYRRHPLERAARRGAERHRGA